MFGLTLTRTHRKAVDQLTEALTRARKDVEELARLLEVEKGQTEPMLRRLAAYCARPSKDGCPPVARAKCPGPCGANLERHMGCWLAWAKGARK